ncbi:hypothetical protein SEA_FORZA_47 [Gordonia phage Forza]|uniref:Uncharacterized protein n=1 Tax=Gordonia phage Forza TaxID=2571247 RepID=A0A650EYA8_9CAUD|nr:hypothetical protein PP303_gp047 [Gordonia phage Forza]QEM41517.1 hypothetical protein SEA_BOOPY_48 [Gordonia phage Boopy]QGT55040.1 hypothetical protein SEA_FORZA_47 [Gordonia phage Forza]UXE04190.1 hypothetical protein SEA_BLUENGOLD_46 [Gordonia phage BlueNGold]WBF03829.1 hypothetical protein SEA_MAREELIH_46 [Gordonia phage Mareelih]
MSHSTHCCPIHGCKYYDDETRCRVALGLTKPVHPENNGCEDCEYENKETPMPRLSHMTTQRLLELRVSVEQASLFPTKWCLSGKCKDTNWGGQDRLHIRDMIKCPPVDVKELEKWAREITEALGEPHRSRSLDKEETKTMAAVENTEVKPKLTDAQFSLLSEIATYARRVKRHAENYGQDLEYLQRAVERGKIPPSVHGEMPNINLINEFIFALTRLAEDFNIPDELVTLALQTNMAEIAVKSVRG